MKEEVGAVVYLEPTLFVLPSQSQLSWEQPGSVKYCGRASEHLQWVGEQLLLYALPPMTYMDRCVCATTLKTSTVGVWERPLDLLPLFQHHLFTPQYLFLYSFIYSVESPSSSCLLSEKVALIKSSENKHGRWFWVLPDCLVTPDWLEDWAQDAWHNIFSSCFLLSKA